MAKVENLGYKPHLAYKVDDAYWLLGGFTGPPPDPYMSTGYRNTILLFGRTFWMGVL